MVVDSVDHETLFMISGVDASGSIEQSSSEIYHLHCHSLIFLTEQARHHADYHTYWIHYDAVHTLKYGSVALYSFAYD